RGGLDVLQLLEDELRLVDLGLPELGQEGDGGEVAADVVVKVAGDALTQRLEILAALHPAPGQGNEHESKDAADAAANGGHAAGDGAIHQLEATFLLGQPVAHEPVAFHQLGDPDIVGHQIATAAVSVDEVIGR